MTNPYQLQPVPAHRRWVEEIRLRNARDDVRHEPIHITGKRGNAVLVAEADWRAIQETLYLVSIPGMRESIRQGMEEQVANCSREIDL